MADPHNVRLIFRRPAGYAVHEVAVQRDGPYIIFSGTTMFGENSTTDAYLINRNDPDAGSSNLTQLRCDGVWGLDISHTGDVVFTTDEKGSTSSLIRS